ncbi:MAG: cytochrome c biogenesis protein CcdA [Firmicutes bacterium]|nr:cytochrome c biogenesis protein CcdA [Bacillota bacterium]MTI69361.1 cytochrome c biogenesis protein CcdA [Bacillota bacterium]
MGDVSIPIAFSAGFISFFSPCILPLIPAYIMYITGTTMEDEIINNKSFVLLRTLGFILGFSIIFMLMGVSASFIGKIFIRNKEIITKISGFFIFLFGLNMIGLLKLNILSKERKIRPKKITNWFSSLFMGMAFAAGWTPCFGPILASILFYAGSEATLSKGVMLLSTYSLGMSIPFILTALFIQRFGNFLKKTEKIIGYMSKVSGIVMIIFGVLIFFNKIKIIANLL